MTYEKGTLVRYKDKIYVLGQSGYVLTGGISRYGLWTIDDWLSDGPVAFLICSKESSRGNFIIPVSDIEMLDKKVICLNSK